MLGIFFKNKGIAAKQLMITIASRSTWHLFYAGDERYFFDLYLSSSYSAKNENKVRVRDMRFYFKRLKN
jgi:hypothetical protein